MTGQLVFLSYARKDGLDAAIQFREKLASEDIGAWQDIREIGPVETVWPQIESALKQASHLIVLVTEAALDSDYIRREARRNGATVLPVLMVDTPRGELPHWLRRFEVYRLDKEESRDKLIDALRRPGQAGDFCGGDPLALIAYRNTYRGFA